MYLAVPNTSIKSLLNLFDITFVIAMGWSKPV